MIKVSYLQGSHWHYLNYFLIPPIHVFYGMVLYLTYRWGLKKENAHYKREKRLPFKNVNISHQRLRIKLTKIQNWVEIVKRTYLESIWLCIFSSPKEEVGNGKMLHSITSLVSQNISVQVVAFGCMSDTYCARRVEACL